MIKLNVIQEDAVRLSVSEAFISGGGKMQSKSVTPTTEVQTVRPDEDFDGLREVEVGAITGALLQSLNADFVAENIKKDIDLFGTIGTLAERFPDIEERTIIHTEDWSSADKGGVSSHFCDVYCNAQAPADGKIYLVWIENTLTANNYGNFVFFHKSASASFCIAVRRGWYNSVSYSSSSQFFVGKNSVIRILTIPE